MWAGVVSRHIINLTLHGIGEPRRPLEYREDQVWLAEDMLPVILDVLQGLSGYLITVDDGNESDVDILLPSLMQRGLKATFFVPAGKIGGPGHLSRGGLTVLARAGMEIGTHGMDHRDWRALTEAELDVEIEGSKRVLEEIVGQRIVKASCPYGSYDRRVLAHVKRAGLERVYTSDRGHANADTWIQPRSSLHATDTSETVRFLVTGTWPLHTRLVRKAKCLVKRWR